jgi:cell division protein FtsB
MYATRRPNLLLILLIVLCGLFVYSYTARLGEKSVIDAEIAAMQARIDQAKMQQQELLAERAALRDPAYLDTVARTVLDHAKPGDKVLTIVKVPDSAAESPAQADLAAPAPAPAVSATLPVWQQWVSFFAGERAVNRLP